MNVRQFFKKLIADTSVYFTILAAIYSALMMVVNVTEDEVLLSASRLLYLFLFAVLAALGQSFFRFATLPRAAKLFLYYGILGLAFYLCLLFPANMRGVTVFIGLVFFTLVYFAAAGIVALFVSRFRANKPQDTAYENQFKKKR